MKKSTTTGDNPKFQSIRLDQLSRGIPMCFLGILVLLTAVCDSWADTLEFEPAKTIVDNADHWWGKALADINGNGLKDFAVINDCAHGGWLGWYETSEDAGAWTQHIVASTAPNGEEFACGDLDLGDFDNDGDIDLLGIAHTGEWDSKRATSTLYWYENDRPTWTPHVIGSVGAFIKDINVADFNNDGKLDIAVVMFVTHSLVVFRQDTPISWSKVQDFSITNLHEGMDAGDIDGDGDPDIAANGYWIENPGGDLTGSWTVRSIDTRWHSDPAGSNFRNNATKVFCRDITGDGKAEVFISDSENAEPIMWYSSTDPKNDSWVGHEIADGYEYVHTLQVFDMDNDGDFDVFAGENGGQVSDARATVFLNRGDNLSWTEHPIDTAGTYNSLVGDVEGDGTPDIWRLHSHSGNIFELTPNVTEHTPSLDEWSYIQVTDQHERDFGLTFGDVTGNGLTDIVSSRYVYRNPGGDMTGAWEKTDIGGKDALFVVDVDGDEFADIMAYNADGLFWHEATSPNGSSWASLQVANGHGADHGISSQGYRLGQIVPGGKPELLISTDDESVYYEIPPNPASESWPSVIIASDTGGEGVDIGDVDNDGLNDVAGRQGGNVVWWKNPGTGADGWTAYMVGTTPNAADRIALADIDSDSRLDLVVSEETGGTSGAGTWWFQCPPDPTDAWTRFEIARQATVNSMEVADFDADGDPDVITGEHRGTEKVILWENDGTGTFTPHEVDTGKENHLGVRPVDLDGDNDFDIVSIAWDDPEFIHLWRNDGGLSAGTVRITEAVDEGRDCYRIDTSTATYFFDKAGGGLTSLLDRDGIDWIGWNPADGSAGEYRGIPNTGELHPGYEGGLTTTDAMLDTPLPSVMIETTRNGWGACWEFFPTFTKMTLHTIPSGTYWMLYEGNPGGAVDAADRLHLSNGLNYSVNQDYPWSSTSSPPDDFEDIANTSGAAQEAEWVFFAASEMARSLFLAHNDDDLEDDYWQMQDNMTVFGFGRSGNSSLLTAVDAELVIGFVDSTNPVTVAGGIHAAWNGIGAVQKVDTPVITPSGGTFSGSVKVSLSCATAQAEIRYTLDGTAPTATDTLYTNSFVLDTNTTVRARGFKTGWLPGNDVEAAFSITPDETPPSLLSATAVGDPNQVELEFDEPLELNTVTSVDNYRITPDITVLGVELLDNGETAKLSVSPLTEGTEYIATVSGVADVAGNVVEPETSIGFQFRPIDVVNGLVAHWRMDERKGGTTLDSAGDHEGILHGPIREAGKLGRALRFDGKDDYVDTGAWDVSGEALTICAWFRADTFTHLSSCDARIVSKAGGVQDNDHTWMLSTIKDGSATRLRFRLKTNGSTKTLIASGGDLAANRWIHAAAVYDGSQMILYKDGTAVGSTAKTGNITVEPNLSVWLGDNPSGVGDRPFDGLLDDARIYARALTSNEVAHLASWSPVTTIDAWGDKHGVSTADLTSDPEEDGLPLLAEYAYGLAPTAPDTEYLLPGKGVKGLPWLGLTEASPSRLAVEYVRRVHAFDIIYRVTFADSLSSGWFPYQQTHTVSRVNATWERVRIEDHLSVTDRKNRFLHIEVEYAP